MAKNKTLELIETIDEKLQKECGALELENDSDRAKLSWWIHEQFVKKDFKNENRKNVMSPGTGEDSKTIRTGDKG